MERVAHILPGASDRWGVSARGALLAAAPAQDNEATGPLSPASLDVIPGHGRNILIRLSPSVVNHHRRESLLLLTSSLIHTAVEFPSCQIMLPFLITLSQSQTRDFPPQATEPRTLTSQRRVSTKKVVGKRKEKM